MVIKFKWMYGCFESLHLKTHCCYSTDLDRDNIQWPIHLHTHSFRPGPDLQTLRPQCKYELWISIETPSYTPQSHYMYQLWSVNNQSTVRVKSLYPQRTCSSWQSSRHWWFLQSSCFCDGMRVTVWLSIIQQISSHFQMTYDKLII